MRCFHFSFLSTLILLFSFFGCNFQDVKPSSSGKPGELIVVIDSTLWKSAPGKIIRDSLMAAYPALPQYEPMFSLIQVQPEHFKNILQLHRNVLMIDTGPLQGDRKYLLTYKDNVWATPQLVLSLRAMDETHLESALLSAVHTIVARFSSEELNRMMQSNSVKNDLPVAGEINKMMGISIPVPQDFFIAKSLNNYVWLRKETVHTSLGFQFARLPYTSDTLFSTHAIIALRDSLSKLNIPGPTEGSFMTTDSNYPYSSSVVTIDSSYSYEVRGLWRTEGDFMGGPFISYLIHDKKKNELLFVDAFVYSPKFNKREYVKQMESLVKSISF